MNRLKVTTLLLIVFLAVPVGLAECSCLAQGPSPYDSNVFMHSPHCPTVSDVLVPVESASCPENHAADKEEDCCPNCGKRSEILASAGREEIKFGPNPRTESRLHKKGLFLTARVQEQNAFFIKKQVSESNSNIAFKKDIPLYLVNRTLLV